MAFSQETLDFLAENKLRGDKNWFHEHEAEYKKYVREPFYKLCDELTPIMLEIDSAFIVEPRRALSRIYRDTRFTKDKSLYRSNMWLTFIRDKKLADGLPGFFFEIGLWGFRYGCGYYCTGTEKMKLFREMLIDGEPIAEEAFDSFYKQDVFTLEGEMYKRPKYTQYGERMSQWLDRKDICFIKNSEDFELLYSDRLADVLKNDLILLKNQYRFMMSVESRINKNIL